MLGISDYWAFVAAVLVFLMLPGPGTFAVLTSTAKGGLRAGYTALAGLMGSTISFLTFACGTALIVSGNWAARRLRANESVGRWQSRFAGVALIGFGARLATE